MRPEDIIGLVIVVAVIALYIGLIVLGVMIAIRKNRSPHWMWFAVHPLGLLITLIVMAALPALKKCPRCTQKLKSYARLCAYCGHDFMIPEQAYAPQPGQMYAPPPGSWAPPSGSYPPPQG